MFSSYSSPIESPQESIEFSVSKMQFATFVALAFATLAAATPARRTSSPGQVCCNSVESASDPAAAAILKSIGVVVQDVNALVGLTCTDVTVVGNSATWYIYLFSSDITPADSFF
jgi:hypothetical protein